MFITDHSVPSGTRWPISYRLHPLFCRCSARDRDREPHIVLSLDLIEHIKPPGFPCLFKLDLFARRLKLAQVRCGSSLEEVVWEQEILDRAISIDGSHLCAFFFRITINVVMIGHKSTSWSNRNSARTIGMCFRPILVSCISFRATLADWIVCLLNYWSYNVTAIGRSIDSDGDSHHLLL